MEVYDKKESGYYEVWLTNEEQSRIDRAELTERLLSEKPGKRYKVVYFLSGSDDLYPNTEKLILMNLGCA